MSIVAAHIGDETWSNRLVKQLGLEKTFTPRGQS